MKDYSYRAIYLGNDQWIVRRFDKDGSGTLTSLDCRESRFSLHVLDPQLRESDKKAIEEAIKRNEWRPL